MNYKLKITKTEANPHYTEELAKYEENRKWRNYDDRLERPESELIKDVLIVELTDEQYKKVKAEVFKAFE